MTVLEIGLALALVALVVLAAFYRAARSAPAAASRSSTTSPRSPTAGARWSETLDAIAAILVPALGDYCMIDVIEEGRVRRAAVRVDGPGAEAIEKGLAERKPALQERSPRAAGTPGRSRASSST